MNKDKLLIGMIVILRNRMEFINIDNSLLMCIDTGKPGFCRLLGNYTDNLLNSQNSDFDIMQVTFQASEFDLINELQTYHFIKDNVYWDRNNNHLLTMSKDQLSIYRNQR